MPLITNHVQKMGKFLHTTKLRIRGWYSLNCASRKEGRRFENEKQQKEEEDQKTKHKFLCTGFHPLKIIIHNRFLYFTLIFTNLRGKNISLEL